MLFFALNSNAQNEFNFDGQLSGVANYSPQNDQYGLLNLRYLPELNYDWKLDTNHSLYFEASANLYGSLSFFKNDSLHADGNISPYRIYARFSGKQYQIRLGLQKIDFGSAMILRPLQWFNEIDPRDPLAITDGVIAGLGRYYFSNNANIWFWILYGNENPRGFDILKSNPTDIEIGGRIQTPLPKGEIALSYHNRRADASNYFPDPEYSEIPENRIGIDGKWDLGIGLWFEGAYIHSSKNIGVYTNQTLITLGMDYTFALGSGLNVVVEHLVSGYEEAHIGFDNSYNTTALNISYPIGFFDNLSFFTTYTWEENATSLFLNYQHDFRRVSGYFMAYYNPDSTSTINNDEFISTFAGPGLRVMIVFNH